MKIVEMIRGFFLEWSRSSKVMQNVIFPVKLLWLILRTCLNYSAQMTEKEISHSGSGHHVVLFLVCAVLLHKHSCSLKRLGINFN